MVLLVWENHIWRIGGIRPLWMNALLKIVQCESEAKVKPVLEDDLEFCQGKAI